MSAAETTAAATSSRWWGSWEPPEGQLTRWRIGPLTLWVRRRPKEWRLAYESTAVDPGTDPELARPADAEPAPTANVQRFVSDRVSGPIEILPALADRAVVSRPEAPLRLLAGAEVSFFVGTPLWLRLDAGDPPRLLLDLPLERPSDTWFGATTHGELCYATRTSARLTREHLDLRPEHAFTRVRLRNRAPDDLLLERLALPAPHLALFADPAGHLWTQDVSVERDVAGALAEVRFGSRPPRGMEGAERVAGPRVRSERNVLVRALGALLS